MRRRVKLAHRLEHLLFSSLLSVAGRLTPDQRARVGTRLGLLAHTPLRIRRTLVETQLQHAFPEAGAEWVERTARETYAHFGRELLAIAQMRDMTPAELRAETVVDGLELLQSALAEFPGAVITAGHLGNWEVGGAAVAVRGVPVDIIVQRQRNPLFNDVIVAVRERFGARLITRKQAPRQALRALRGGRVVIFAADQNAGRHGVFVPFFSRLASTHRGPALMAIRAGVPLFAAAAHRLADGRLHVRVERVEFDRTGDLEEVVQRATAAFTARLEAAVRRTPEQYFWFHKRWKTRPREEQPGAKKVP